ncbi:MAG TPA: sugar phosphate isomerase/epimerase [Pirellulales bacterium]|nr:sugar phosphate isomerase/epimerase [Pirellulales bacterium]
MKPALSQVSTLNASFASDVEDYAAAACDCLELWLGKLETYLDEHSLAEVKALLTDHGVTAPVAAFQGGLLASQGDARRAHWDHFARRLELLRELGVGTLVVAGDVLGALTQQDLERVQFSLQQAANAASLAGVRLALEFQAQATIMNNLQTAAAFVAEVASPHLGLCLDAFHFYMGPSKEEDLLYLTPHNLFHVQLCDTSGTARELATDADRILPGDGDFNLQPIIERLRAIEYQGCVSIELMNPQIWQIPPRQVAEVAMTALRKLLGQASMQ